MQQRRLRLGDILDDYCPRERRITNHVVVAMIEDDVKQTRCSTCDADHEYKQARVPLRRRKEGVLVGDSGAGPRPRPVAAIPDDVILDDDDVMPEDHQRALHSADAADTETAPATVVHAASTDGDEPADEPQPQLEEDGPVHRRLIRATLPRPEGQAPEWKDPDFTIRQPSNGRGGFDGNRNGHRPPGNGAPGGPRRSC